MPTKPSPFELFSRWLGGIDRVGESGLPVEEFAHPWPLLAMALLGVNDHVLKGSGWLPGWMTGKLSDFAGMFFFPLFVTAAVDTLLWVAFRLSKGRTPDYSLSLGKLWGAVIFTAILFVPLKLSDTWGTLYIEAMHVLDVFDWFGNFQVTRDPTDLVSLVMFPLVLLFGRRFVRRVPVGRMAVMRSAAQGLGAKERRATLAERTRDVRRLLGGDERRGKALDRLLDALTRAFGRGGNDRAVQQAETRLDEYRETLERAA